MMSSICDIIQYTQTNTHTYNIIVKHIIFATLLLTTVKRIRILVEHAIEKQAENKVDFSSIFLWDKYVCLLKDK